MDLYTLFRRLSSGMNLTRRAACVALPCGVAMSCLRSLVRAPPSHRRSCSVPEDYTTGLKPPDDDGVMSSCWPRTCMPVPSERDGGQALQRDANRPRATASCRRNDAVSREEDRSGMCGPTARRAGCEGSVRRSAVRNQTTRWSLLSDRHTSVLHRRTLAPRSAGPHEMSSASS